MPDVIVPPAFLKKPIRPPATATLTPRQRPPSFKEPCSPSMGTAPTDAGSERVIDAIRNRTFVVDYSVNLYENHPMADVRLTAEAQEQFTALPRTIQTRVTRLLERLEQWPAVSGAKPLRGDLAGTYRLRTGDYRLQFHVEGETVFVEKIGHRDGFYED
jgi:mRNA interferase RelE/StbE